MKKSVLSYLSLLMLLIPSCSANNVVNLKFIISEEDAVMTFAHHSFNEESFFKPTSKHPIHYYKNKEEIKVAIDLYIRSNPMHPDHVSDTLFFTNNPYRFNSNYKVINDIDVDGNLYEQKDGIINFAYYSPVDDKYPYPFFTKKQMYNLEYSQETVTITNAIYDSHTSKLTLNCKYEYKYHDELHFKETVKASIITFWDLVK